MSQEGSFAMFYYYEETELSTKNIQKSLLNREVRLL